MLACGGCQRDGWTAVRPLEALLAEWRVMAASPWQGLVIRCLIRKWHPTWLSCSQSRGRHVFVLTPWWNSWNEKNFRTDGGLTNTYCVLTFIFPSGNPRLSAQRNSLRLGLVPSALYAAFPGSAPLRVLMMSVGSWLSLGFSLISQIFAKTQATFFFFFFPSLNQISHYRMDIWAV